MREKMKLKFQHLVIMLRGENYGKWDQWICFVKYP